MNTTTETELTSAPQRTRLKASQLVIIIGVAVAAFTAMSGIASWVISQDPPSDNAVAREVFGGIPGPLKAAFYIVIPLVLLYGAVLFSQRVRNWERGRPDNRALNARTAKRRARDFRAGVWMKTLLRDPAAGLMHSMIYFSFLVLLAVTITLEINYVLPANLKFLEGGVYQGYAFIGDAAGLVLVIGCVWALVRRYGQRPYRIRVKNKPEHLVGLSVILFMAVSGFFAEAYRIANEGMPEFERWSFVGYPMAVVLEGTGNVAGWQQFWWVTHVLSFVVFLVLIPVTMLRHIFTSPLNMWMRDRERPKGAMKPMPNLMETELESFGVATIEDFTWKQLLDLDACTMCGRCTSVCPANGTGKPLDPREIVLKSGEVMAATGDPKVSPPIGVDGEITVSANSLFERITAEEVWACTTCKACDEICPVNIEIMDKILDMRRYLSLMESDFPTELGNAYRAMENQGNPWGMNQGDRSEWAEKLDIDVPVVDGSGDLDHEYLYWVGCAGSFDDKNKKVTQAMAKLLTRAGVDFAILGASEMCTGDSARRSGNEYIFQMLAMQNIETMNGMGVKKIITQCPHCFNTLLNEYPQLGGNYEVVHHTQLLEALVDNGQLDLSRAKLEERVVYHDSCYLGRHNDVYMAPRKLIGSLGGVEVVEAGRNGTTGMCCGAGGARMWMEESTGKQVNVDRSQELLATGATRIATACPFCYIMIDDGVKGEGVDEDQVRVGDIALHMLEALEEGDRAEVALQAPDTSMS